ncbi:MAG: TIGR04211 family SH3 domain-containing protein [Proteobacteria bacterium]|nr:TIGR04211 family SH3 domain-containing protein [Desulfobacula sp.]MBU3954797.1 TIGR04211 family SH3 domain-containing protein [Pseudomonadota bacterium]MBU4131402.1 TIGR04211 family SH3 domain-containing protein [Pseudomonadota bacterium]
MRKMMKLLASICLLGWVWAGPLAAQDIYVSGITKITMRTGPGVEHKIVAMLTSGSKLETIEYKSDWSHVRTQEGKSGWVLSRFLTQEVPQTLLVEQLQAENKRLTAALAQAEGKNQALAEKSVDLVDIEEKYKKLEQASADFLKLNDDYKALTRLSQDQKDRIQALEQNMNNEEKLWFLSGAGVFIVGLIIGLSTRKKKRNSLL